MPLNITNFAVAATLLNRRGVSKDKLLAGALTAGVVPGVLGLAVPLLLAPKSTTVPIKNGSQLGPGGQKIEIVEKVPNFSGRTSEQAQHIAKGLGFQLNVQRVRVNSSNGAPVAEEVIDQNPSTGTYVALGATVTVRIPVNPAAEESDDCKKLRVLGESLAKEVAERGEAIEAKLNQLVPLQSQSGHGAPEVG